MAIYDRERSRVVLPQLEERLESLELGVDVKCETVETDPFDVSSYISNVSADFKPIKGYTPFLVDASVGRTGSYVSYCIIYAPRIEGNTALCGVRYLKGIYDSQPESATGITVIFKILFIADKKLLAMKESGAISGGGSSGGGGGGGTTNYNELTNKPSIESVELIGDKSFVDLGLEGMTNIELYNIVNGTDLLGE